MGLLDFFKSVRNLLRYSHKSGWDELSGYLKLFLLALVLIGGIGLLIHLAAFWLSVR
ncbi:MAG: protein translocase SEC61 complex subunit gamma [Nitrososphaeria archaeon]